MIKWFIGLFLILNGCWASGLKAQGNYSQLAQNILFSVKYDEEQQSKLDSLANINLADLKNELHNDAIKKAFWLNLYNAFVQMELQKHPHHYKQRRVFYKTKFIRVAGHMLSLDDIEHGMIRHSKNKFLFGYVNKFITTDFEKQLRCEALDNRIHFALNCGAKSCPPILYYEPQKIDQQLDLATQGYLLAECKIEHGCVYVPMLFSWFRGDFGGKRNMIRFLEKYSVVAHHDSIKKIRFIPYDWTLLLQQYKFE